MFIAVLPMCKPVIDIFLQECKLLSFSEHFFLNWFMLQICFPEGGVGCAWLYDYLSRVTYFSCNISWHFYLAVLHETQLGHKLVFTRQTPWELSVGACAIGFEPLSLLSSHGKTRTHKEIVSENTQCLGSGKEGVGRGLGVLHWLL